MLEKITYYSILLILIMLSSCGSVPQSYFVPHEGNVAKLKEKNDLKVSASYLSNNSYANTFGSSSFGSFETSSEKSRASFQVAYSPIKHLGVFGVHSRLKMVDINFPENVFHKSHITGGGVGSYYYFTFEQRPARKVLEGKKVKYTKILFDLYGGYTFGKLENQYYQPEAFTQMNFQKFYLQGGAHWEGSNWGFSYVQKFGAVNYLNGVIKGQPNSYNDGAIQSILNKNNLFFTEATFKLDVQVKGVGLYTQITTGNIRDFNGRSVARPISSFGIILDIQQIRNAVRND